jgi:hypothetical protein
MGVSMPTLLVSWGFRVNGFDSGAGIGGINAVVSVEHVVQSTQQEVKVILERLRARF